MAEAGVARVLENPAAEAGRISGEPEAERERLAEERWKPVLELGCELTVELPLPEFKIGDLLELRAGAVIDAHWRVGQDVPLHLNATLIGWGEFEMVSGNLAVRLMEVA
jgi:flagellar motor switch/type III secretory pathway protein FliN